MNKFIPLLFGLMLPLAGAFADDFTDQAVEFCRSKGGSYSMGSMVEEGDNYCRQVTCKKTNAADGRLQIPDGEKGPEANVEATKRVCIKKSIIDGNFNTAGTGNSSGSQSGSQSGAQSGSQSGAQSGSQSGAQSGSQSGAQSGSQSGAQSGSGSGSGGGDGDITCTTSTGQVLAIGPYHHCYEACKASGIWPFRKKGLERKSCVECLMGIGYDFDASIKKKVGLVMVGGVSVTVCKDKNGNVVARDSVSGLCPNGNNIGFSGGSSSSGGIVISGGVGGGVGGSGGINWPEYCLSGKKKDEEKCHKWMLLNKRYVCSSGADVSICTGGANADIMARYDINNCVNCQAGSRQQSNLSGWAEIIGAAAPIVTGGLGAYFGYKSQKAWAGAAEAGFEQCQIDHNNYYQYLSANELPGLTPGQQQGMNCNGYSLGGYAGLQNPMLGGWYGAGYTPGMIGGMMGPYGGYNPYGGGYVGGVAGGYVGGMAGGYVGGISIAGGVAGGYPGGYAGGYVGGMAGGYPGGYAGGMAGGYPGGYAGGMAGGYVGGMAGGYPGGYAGGYTGGYAGGMAGGFVNGISIAGGYNGGFNGGYAGGYATGGGYAAGGYMAGGYTPGGYAGGYMAGGFNGGGGYAAGGYAGGYAAGGYAGGGYAAGGYAGGMAGGYDYASSQQAANYDRMMQQQGTSFQMGMGGMGGGYTGGAFGAGGYPMNAGFGIQASLGGGFGF